MQYISMTLSARMGWATSVETSFFMRPIIEIRLRLNRKLKKKFKFGDFKLKLFVIVHMTNSLSHL